MERLFSISVKVVVSILFQKARKVLNNERGEANYFSTVVFIFIAVLLLAFIIDLFSIISTKQELDHAADQMVKQIQLSGGVNGETDELFEFLSSQIEGAENISYSIDATYTSPRPSGMTNAYAPGQSTDAEEEYPKVTSQTEDEVVIDFTDTEKLEETPPPVPEGKTEIKDPGQEHTVNPDPSVPEVTAPPAEQAPPSNEPVPGSSNGNGAVYDPVFGWVVPGNVQQSTGDSDGDLNKQVGNMG